VELELAFQKEEVEVAYNLEVEHRIVVVAVNAVLQLVVSVLHQVELHFAIQVVQQVEQLVALALAYFVLFDIALHIVEYKAVVDKLSAVVVVQGIDMDMVVDIHSSVADNHSYKDNMEEEVGNMYFEEFVDIVEFAHMHLHSVVEMVAKKHFDFEY
jgi:hypothetical protein